MVQEKPIAVFPRTRIEMWQVLMEWNGKNHIAPYMVAIFNFNPGG